MEKIIPFAHNIIGKRVLPTDIAVDATAGNGLDTVFLAARCEHVYAFDVQQSAISATKSRLQEEGLENVTLIKASHAEMGQHLKTAPKVIMFNLGYLPGGDKSLSTRAEETLIAIKEALNMLSVHGLLSITFYTGHPEGKREADRLLPYLSTLSSKTYNVLRYEFINKSQAPFVVLVEKLQE